MRKSLIFHLITTSSRSSNLYLTIALQDLKYKELNCGMAKTPICVLLILSGIEGNPINQPKAWFAQNAQKYLMFPPLHYLNESQCLSSTA